MGDTSTAAGEYAAGLAADPTSITLQRGQARVAMMSGHAAAAVDGYAALTRRAPTPGYLLEYVELLRANGRDGDAETQLRLATAAHQLFLGNGGVDGAHRRRTRHGRWPPSRRGARHGWSGRGGSTPTWPTRRPGCLI